MLVLVMVIVLGWRRWCGDGRDGGEGGDVVITVVRLMRVCLSWGCGILIICGGGY